MPNINENKTNNPVEDSKKDLEEAKSKEEAQDKTQEKLNDEEGEEKDTSKEVSENKESSNVTPKEESNDMPKKELLERFNNEEFRNYMICLSLEDIFQTSVNDKTSWQHLFTEKGLLDGDVGKVFCNSCKVRVPFKGFLAHLTSKRHYESLKTIEQFFHPAYTYTRKATALMKGEKVDEKELQKSIRNANSAIRIPLHEAAKQFADNVRDSFLEKVVLSKPVDNVEHMYAEISLTMPSLIKVLFSIKEDEWKEMLTADDGPKATARFQCNICEISCEGIEKMNEHLSCSQHLEKQLACLGVQSKTNINANKYRVYREGPKYTVSIKKEAKVFYADEVEKEIKTLIKTLGDKSGLFAQISEEIMKKGEALRLQKEVVLSTPREKYDESKQWQNDGLIGVEYVIQKLQSLDQKLNKFECCLCSGTILENTKMAEHLIGYKHRLKYFERHYPSTLKDYKERLSKLECYDNSRVMGVIFEKLAAAIENHYGYGEIRDVPISFFKNFRVKILDEINNGPHANEESGDLCLKKIVSDDELKAFSDNKSLHAKKTNIKHQQPERFCQRSKKTYCNSKANQKLKNSGGAKGTKNTSDKIGDNVKGLSIPNEGLIGVEFIIKLLMSWNKKKDKYECTLCNARLTESFMAEHLVEFNHRQNYFQIYYPSTLKHYKNKVGTINYNDYIRVMSIIFARLAAALEDHYGYDRVNEVPISIYDHQRDDLIAKAVNSPHASEKTGPKFLNLISDKEIEEYKKNPKIKVNHSIKHQTPERFTLRSKKEYKIGKGNKSRSPIRRGNRDEDNIWNAYRTLMSQIVHQIELKYLEYRQYPENHPLYKEEWNSFWQNRKQELMMQGIDPRGYNFQAEWSNFFLHRLDVFLEIELQNAQLEVRRHLNIPLDAVEDMISLEPQNKRARLEETDCLLSAPNWPAGAGGEVNEPLGDPVLQQPITDNKPNVIHVLRLLAALEEHLGSLAGKVLDLLSKALLLEKNFGNNPAELEAKILNASNCTLIETAAEKLKGILYAGLLDPNKVQSFNVVIQNTADLLQHAEKMGYRKVDLEQAQPSLSNNNPDIQQILNVLQNSDINLANQKNISDALLGLIKDQAAGNNINRGNMNSGSNRNAGQQNSNNSSKRRDGNREQQNKRQSQNSSANAPPNNQYNNNQSYRNSNFGGNMNDRNQHQYERQNSNFGGNMNDRNQQQGGGGGVDGGGFYGNSSQQNTDNPLGSGLLSFDTKLSSSFSDYNLASNSSNRNNYNDNYPSSGSRNQGMNRNTYNMGENGNMNANNRTTGGGNKNHSNRGSGWGGGGGGNRNQGYHNQSQNRDNFEGRSGGGGGYNTNNTPSAGNSGNFGFDRENKNSGRGNNWQQNSSNNNQQQQQPQQKKARWGSPNRQQGFRARGVGGGSGGGGRNQSNF